MFLRSVRWTAAQHLRTLFNLVATNSEVRKLLTDFGLIGRDLLAVTASKAAETIRPDPEALAGVDQSAPHDEFKPLEVNPPGVDGVGRLHPDGRTEVERNGELMSGSEAMDRTKVQGLGAAQQAKERAKVEADVTAQ